jgi:ATP-dependent Clp protease ATP-binding subunit ClpA
VYGARPITRWIEIKVVSELSRMLIWEEIDENTTVFVDAGPNGSGLVYRVENNDENTTVFVDAGPNGSGLVYRVENNEEIVNAETEVKSDILILTSKLGAERLPSGLSGKCTKQVARDRVMQEVRNYFRPNFLYELDEVVVFDPLSLEPLRKVARLQINDVANRLAKKGIALAVTDAALDYVLAESYDPVSVSYILIIFL